MSGSDDFSKIWETLDRIQYHVTLHLAQIYRALAGQDFLVSSSTHRLVIPAITEEDLGIDNLSNAIDSYVRNATGLSPEPWSRRQLLKTTALSGGALDPMSVFNWAEAAKAYVSRFVMGSDRGARFIIHNLVAGRDAILAGEGAIVVNRSYIEGSEFNRSSRAASSWLDSRPLLKLNAKPNPQAVWEELEIFETKPDWGAVRPRVKALAATIDISRPMNLSKRELFGLPAPELELTKTAAHEVIGISPSTAHDIFSKSSCEGFLKLLKAPDFASLSDWAIKRSFPTKDNLEPPKPSGKTPLVPAPPPDFDPLAGLKSRFRNSSLEPPAAARKIAPLAPPLWPDIDFLKGLGTRLPTKELEPPKPSGETPLVPAPLPDFDPLARLKRRFPTLDLEPPAAAKETMPLAASLWPDLDFLKGLGTRFPAKELEPPKPSGETPVVPAPLPGFDPLASIKRRFPTPGLEPPAAAKATTPLAASLWPDFDPLNIPTIGLGRFSSNRDSETAGGLRKSRPAATGTKPTGKKGSKK